MNRDTLRLLLIVAALLALLGAYIMFSEHQEASRPVLQEVRVVSACGSDPVFRDGARQLDAAEELTLAVALRIEEAGKGSYWLAPVDRLMLEGEAVEHVKAEHWPEEDRYARVFWFTLECSHVGGELHAGKVSEWLQYRTFLMQEMGQELRAEPVWRAGNAEFLGKRAGIEEVQAGTLRFYARVEIADKTRRVRALQAATSLGLDQLDNPALPVISRRLQLPEGLHAEAGELFLLPAFEPVGAGQQEQDQVTSAELGMTFSQLVQQRRVTSSASLAAVAVSGMPQLDPEQLQRLGDLRVKDDGLLRGSSPVHWGQARQEVRAGDLLVSGPPSDSAAGHAGRHWLVLVEDDGNGILDEPDLVLHCWRKSPALQSLGEAIKPQETRFELLRHGQ